MVLAEQQSRVTFLNLGLKWVVGSGSYALLLLLLLLLLLTIYFKIRQDKTELWSSLKGNYSVQQSKISHQYKTI